MENDAVPPADHQLCGYLRAVVTAPEGFDIPMKSILHFGGVPPDIYFAASDDFRLIPIGRPQDGDSEVFPSVKNLKKAMGMVHGSISVVHQLYELVRHKCVRIVARVVNISAQDGDAVSGSREYRALVLVDVYLPVLLWSGWQFPRSRVVAASLLRHLSCDWESRNMILQSTKLDKDDHYCIWNVADCHTLHCGRHCSVLSNPKRKKPFELQEIFKSLSCMTKDINYDGSSLKPINSSLGSGICSLSDDILVNILNLLRPADLALASLTCRHLRYLASSIMPCMKLKLYPHQLAAVNWMLQREKEHANLGHPLYITFKTEEGFDLNINIVSGEIVPGVVPKVRDFRGGLFCDEPGLGKTITALSLILKQQGTLPDPPTGVQVTWLMHEGDRRFGYYEMSSDMMTKGNASKINKNGQRVARGQLSLHALTPKKISSGSMQNSQSPIYSSERTMYPTDSNRCKLMESCTRWSSTPVAVVASSKSRRWGNTKRNLMDSFEGPSFTSETAPNNEKLVLEESKPKENQDGLSYGRSFSKKRDRQSMADTVECNETWVQCDACSKWRKLTDGHMQNTSIAWYCRMNRDPSYQSCCAPEEVWDHSDNITYLPGFHAKGSSGGQEENISFFVGVLKEHSSLVDSETKEALTWLAKLSPNKLKEMESVGLKSPVVGTSLFDSRVSRGYHKFFLAFGLIKRVVKSALRWYYPPGLLNLDFDLDSLRIALCEPFDLIRLYLSSATLIVVPANLVDHWKTQIERHISPGQLRVYIWSDQKKKPSALSLAWDYDVVLTTFNRLSSEWRIQKRSALMQVHWLRLMLDEGHTLGSSLSLTNKLQMAISLTAQSRWLLTGTPTPNTPCSQISYLQPMLKFLKEEVYGLHQKSWEAGILCPYEAEMEEGRLRLLQLLNRCMISARKIDLRAIPPCMKKVTLVDFSEVHAESYNQLVETVRRNILMADWSDPSHIESLLNPKQWKFRAATIRNLRLSCCVAGHVMLRGAEQDIQETMEILVGNGLDPMSKEHTDIEHSLLFGGDCMRCLEWCRLPVITPCKHLLCLDCVSLESEKCSFPGCGYLYEMQSPEELARPENPNPKWPVPKDLIELQPSYKQDDWNPHWESTSSSKVTYLVSQLTKLQKNNGLMGYSSERVDVSSNNAHVDQVAYNKSGKECSYVSEKVIIFSQFLEHIHVIEQQLTIAGIQFAGLYSPMHSSNKIKSLASFQHDSNCTALLMDGSAALGLDLSFVTHVYLMEPIWDRSMEEQVISRAHRMGATRPIHVETLAMSGTIEEQMLNFLQDGDGCEKLLKEIFHSKEREGTRSFRTLHDFAESNYLAHLRFVRSKSRVKKAEAHEGFSN